MGADGFEVAASPRFAHGDGQQHLAARGSGQPLLFLRLGAVAHYVGCHDVGMQAETQAAHARTGQLFNQHGAMAKVAATAAVFFRHGRAQQAFAPGFEPGFTVYPASFVPFGLAGQAFFFNKTPRRLAKSFVVFAVNATGEGEDRFHSV